MNALNNKSLSTGYGAYIQGLYNDRDINTDWRALTENRAALMQKINGTVSGGNEMIESATILP